MTTTIAFVVALVVGVLVPAINLYALLVILLTVPLQWLFNRRTAAGPGQSLAVPNTSSRKKDKTTTTNPE